MKKEASKTQFLQCWKIRVKKKKSIKLSQQARPWSNITSKIVSLEFNTKQRYFKKKLNYYL